MSGIEFIAPDRVLGQVKLCIEGLFKFEGFFIITTFFDRTSNVRIFLS